MSSYAKTRGRAPLQASQFVNSLRPSTTPQPDISATDTSPANPSLSIACGHFPSPIGVGGRTGAISSSSTSTLDPQRLPADRVAPIAKNASPQVLCLPLLQTPPLLSPFPATLTKTPGVAYPLQIKAASISSIDLQPSTLNLTLPSSDLTRHSPLPLHGTNLPLPRLHQYQRPVRYRHALHA